MRSYLLKRLLLVIPTLFVIMLINFSIIQLAPGGPVEKFIAQLNQVGQTGEVSAVSGISGGSSFGSIENAGNDTDLSLIDKEIAEKINKLYGFDKGFWERFFMMLKKFLVFVVGYHIKQECL